MNNLKVPSPSSIKTKLHSVGLYGKVKLSKPKLTSRHREIHYAWAKKYLPCIVDDWKNAIFSDEVPVNLLNSDGREWIWRRVNEKPTDKIVKPSLNLVKGK